MADQGFFRFVGRENKERLHMQSLFVEFAQFDCGKRLKLL